MSLQEKRKEDRSKWKDKRRAEEKESREKKSSAESSRSRDEVQPAGQSVSHSQPVSQSQPVRHSPDSKHGRQSAAQPAAELVPPNVEDVWIDSLCLHQGPKAKRPRVGLAVPFPRAEFRDFSEKVFGLQTKDRVDAMGCLRVLRHVPRLRGLPAHTDPKRSHDVVRTVKQYRDVHRCTSTRQKACAL